MNQINIFNHDINFSIQIQQLKYCIGYNHEMKYQLFQMIRQVYSRVGSEKREEYGIRNVITFDSEEFNVRSSMLWEVSSSYSLTEEMKLGTKSLITTYLETKLQNTIYFDSMNTLEILFNSLEFEINEEDNVNVIFNSVNSKTLFKFMKACLKDGDLQQDEYDLSYEQIILLQIKMIAYIMKHKIYNIKPIIIVHAPVLTDKIIQALWEIPNVCVLVDTVEYLPNMNIKDIALFESGYTDCGDIETIYRIIDQRYCRLVLLNQVEEQMKEYLKKYYSTEHANLTEFLANFNTK